MSQRSKIEWTEMTWNPIRGCVKVSPGCKHCYAETFAERFRGVPDHPYEYGFAPRLVPAKLLEPLSWTTPRTVFVNSMSDLFRDAIPDEYVAAVSEVMIATPWHTFQVLTKRADRLRLLLSGKLERAAEARHIWWGASVEDRRHGLPRVDSLRRSPAKLRFLSVEPLLEDIGAIDLSGIHWVIVGGESGAGARPMRKEWVESIRDQCTAADTLFFFKQWGGVRKGRNGRILDGRLHDDMPAKPVAAVPSVGIRRELARSLSSLTEGWSDSPLVRLNPQNAIA